MIRTGYSFKRAYGHLEDVLSRIQEVGLPAAPIADHCSTFGFVRWSKLCKKAGIKPVYGVEIPVSPNIGDKKPTVDNWTFIAKDSLKPLHELIESATSNPGKDAILSYKQAMSATGVFKIAGHAARLDHMEPQDGLFVGLSPAVSKGFFRQASEAGHSFVARSDNYYPREGDKELYRAALGWRSNTQTYPMWILSPIEWSNALNWVPYEERMTALSFSGKILEESNAQLVKAENLKPERDKSLRELCIEGAAKLGCDITEPTYAARLEREIELIERKGFDDYIYIIADMVAWAKQRMVVGPARGSSCGSLVCYLTGITTIDPIKYNLLFERFIDANRNDPPDIDIDFSADRRDQMFEYAEAKYGADHVARLGTVGQFRAKSALNQVGIALGIPPWQITNMAEAVVPLADGDADALNTVRDAFENTAAGRKFLAEWPEAKIAAEFEGHPDTSSKHAAGLVITERPVVEYVAVNSKTPRTAMCDKKDAEDLNLLKIDALGLKQLSIFERCLQLIGRPDRSDGWLESLPLDDPAAFNVLNNGHFSGIFQFEGNALKTLTKKVEVMGLEDLVALTALARPGPLASGGAEEWVSRKTGAKPVSYYHPAFEPILKDTLGIIVYQEQVMRIGREVGEMDWPDVIDLRKAIGKKLGDAVLNSFKEKFAIGARRKGVPDYIIDAVWRDVCTFGTYGFNKSHAVAYGVVSYWCMWLKAHYPVEFAAATLDDEKDTIKQLRILRELDAEGVGYVPVDVEASGARWEIKKAGDKKILVGPLTQIKGIGAVKVKTIIDSRTNGKELPKALKALVENAKTEIDTLYPIEAAIRKLHPDLDASGIQTTPTKIAAVQPGKTRGEVVIMGVVQRITEKNENDEASVARRGREFTGPTTALNMFVADDTDEIFVKIDRWKFERMGIPILERKRAGAALYAFKGTCPDGFRMISVTQAKYLGDIDDAK
jgi:DNA polymerase III alpha subunit